MGATPLLSDQLRLAIPGAIAVFLLVLSAVPIGVGPATLTPNIVFLMTLTVGMLYPAAWPVALAFFLGLVSDFIFGTPLGAQALLALFLTIVAQRQARRTSHQLLQTRWIEAALTLLMLHVLTWAITRGVLAEPLPIKPVLISAGVNALWFPLFYLLTLWMGKLLPSRG